MPSNVEANHGRRFCRFVHSRIGIIYIDARPLFSPEFVDTTGETLGAATLNVNEDGSGVLSGVNVLVGNQLNPTGTEVQLSLDTNQVPVSLTASVLGSGTNLVPTTSAGIAVFTLTAAEIARGIEFSVDADDIGSEDLTGGVWSGDHVAGDD